MTGMVGIVTFAAVDVIVVVVSIFSDTWALFDVALQTDAWRWSRATPEPAGSNAIFPSPQNPQLPWLHH